jgi:hypothetical protein
MNLWFAYHSAHAGNVLLLGERSGLIPPTRQRDHGAAAQAAISIPSLTAAANRCRGWYPPGRPLGPRVAPQAARHL